MKNYSNYHNTNENQKISHDGLLLLERSLNGFEGYDVSINNSTNSKVLVYQKYDAASTVKKVIGRIEDIEIGNVMTIENLNWLIITLPEDNKIYRKAEMQLCNSTYPIKSTRTRVLKLDSQGKPVTDKFGDPVYIYTDGAITSLPCIVESSIIAADENKQLPLPQGQLRVTMSYRDDVKVNDTFSMYNNTYKIRGIDYTKVINAKGIMVLAVEQVQSEVK
jgi:hypothetical protein